VASHLPFLKFFPDCSLVDLSLCSILTFVPLIHSPNTNVFMACLNENSSIIRNKRLTNTYSDIVEGKGA